MEINYGDTAWLLTSAALVMLMTPALGLFYAGMTRGKNVLATIMQSFIMVALISVIWVLWGYSLAFGPSFGGVIGGLQWVGFNGVTDAPSAYAPTVPHLAFAIYQCMFAIITPALITGAFAERKKFSTFIVFSLAWSTLVYTPIAHWVWSCTPIDGAATVAGCAGVPGWLRALGALDFAGGTVVHISSGVSALAAALVFGRRLGWGADRMEPHDISLTVIGASLLWFGWFGFNAGSALGASGLAANAFVVTNTAAAAAALSWMFVSWRASGKPSVLGAASGAVAGLVAITPAAGFVTPGASIVIGLVAGLVCYYAVQYRNRLQVDDSLDVVGVHFAGGAWGALATGLFATVSVNPAGADGLIAGNPLQLAIQALAVVVVSLYAFVVTWALLKILDKLMGLRVKPEEELAGLDMSIHGESTPYRVRVGDVVGLVVTEEPTPPPQPAPRPSA
ncbi:MAG: ammonium transporter [Dehalococcoidia bacterium]|nr:ammonium transporter [Dehalococcoidia bacterium]